MSPLVLLTLVLFLAVVVMKRRSASYANLPPAVGNSLPIIGCFPRFACNALGLIRESYEKNGDVFTLCFFGRRLTFFVGPEAQAAFFRCSDEEISPKEAYKFMVPVFGPGVVYDSPMEVMFEQLRFVKNGLVVSQLKKAVPIIANESRNFFKTRWGDTGIVDVLEDFNKLTILTASRCLMGEDIRKHLSQQDHFAKLYHDLEAGINTISYFFPYFPIPSVKQRDRAREEIARIFLEVIKFRRENPDDSHDGILNILMESKYKDGSVLDDQQMVGIMIGLLFAGQHTSSITASWVGLMLHQQENKRYLDDVIQEQKALWAEFGEINFDFLKKAVKLENCVREVLRLYPPLVILMRKVHQPVTYKNYTVPVDDFMCVSPGVSMRLDASFPNPERFDPDRWDRSEQNAAPFSYIAFGGGKHSCPGENFGILQIKTIWSVLFATHDFDVVDKSKPVPDYESTVVGPRGPCLIRYSAKK